MQNEQTAASGGQLGVASLILGGLGGSVSVTIDPSDLSTYLLYRS